MPQRLFTLLAGTGLAITGASAAAQVFPEGATTPGAAEVRKHLEGKVFDVGLADGTSWRLEYKSNGYFFVNTSTGFNGSGQWQAEDGRLCGQLRGGDRSCNEVRFSQDRMHLKRNSGEVIQYRAK
jgi:hypothetical protein